MRSGQDSITSTTPLLGENTARTSASQSQQLWKKEAWILAFVALGMALIAGILGAYALLMHTKQNGGSSSSQSRRLRLHVSAASVTRKLTPNKGRHEVPDSHDGARTLHTDRRGADTEDEGEAREDASEENRRFLSGQDDLYDHVHTSIGYFDGREEGL
mmetsp:Transcript_27622/g.55779  ORF Transcript_27622/g.55779 Transcript_27622/m.55779 type:complete len:159 (+) Transcript_27622:1564-2040(+)